MIKAVVYDLDDTLVNSDSIHTQAWNEELKPFGYSQNDLPLEIRLSFTGRRVIDITEIIVDYFKLPIDIQRLYESKNALYYQLVEKQLELLPGVIESLELLKQSYPLAIGTSGTKKYVDIVFKKFSLEPYFKIIVCGDDVKQGKPNPETYLLAAEKLGVDANNCLVFEDAAKGIQAAKSAGCFCIAIVNTNIPPQDLRQADMVLQSLHEVTDPLIKSIK